MVNDAPPMLNAKARALFAQFVPAELVDACDAVPLPPHDGPAILSQSGEDALLALGCPPDLIATLRLSEESYKEGAQEGARSFADNVDKDTSEVPSPVDVGERTREWKRANPDKQREYRRRWKQKQREQS